MPGKHRDRQTERQRQRDRVRQGQRERQRHIPCATLITVCKINLWMCACVHLYVYASATIHRRERGGIPFMQSWHSRLIDSERGHKNPQQQCLLAFLVRMQTCCSPLATTWAQDTTSSAPHVQQRIIEKTSCLNNIILAGLLWNSKTHSHTSSITMTFAKCGQSQ